MVWSWCLATIRGKQCFSLEYLGVRDGFRCGREQSLISHFFELPTLFLSVCSILASAGDVNISTTGKSDPSYIGKVIASRAQITSD